MTTCEYCDKPGADEKLMAHSECWKEFDRRRDSGICTKCGKRPKSNDEWGELCDSCGKLSEYRGYPPEASPRT